MQEGGGDPEKEREVRRVVDKFKIMLHTLPEGVPCVPCIEAKEALDKLKRDGWDIEVEEVVPPADSDDSKYSHAPVLEISGECGCTTIHGFSGIDDLKKKLESITCRNLKKQRE